MVINLLKLFHSNGIKWKLIARRFTKEITCDLRLVIVILFYEIHVMVFGGWKQLIVQKIDATNTIQNDIIEFHIRSDESQFPYTLEMLLWNK